MWNFIEKKILKRDQEKTNPKTIFQSLISSIFRQVQFDGQLPQFGCALVAADAPATVLAQADGCCCTASVAPSD